MAKVTFRVSRGDVKEAKFVDYQTEVGEGMVVLDAVHQIQAESAPDLAARWNCKAGKCGSCSAEINGMPRLMCMTRLSDIDVSKPVVIEPMRAFPRIKDLVTDVSWNYEVKKRIKPLKPRKPDAEDGTWRMQQSDIDRRESRGGHFRDDYPDKSDEFAKHNTFIKKGPSGEMELSRVPITELRADLKDIIEEQKK